VKRSFQRILVAMIQNNIATELSNLFIQILNISFHYIQYERNINVYNAAYATKFHVHVLPTEARRSNVGSEYSRFIRLDL